MMTIESAIARIAELDKKISEYPHWCAALTAMDEERRGLVSFVAGQHSKLAHNKTPSMHAGSSE